MNRAASVAGRDFRPRVSTTQILLLNGPQATTLTLDTPGHAAMETIELCQQIPLCRRDGLKPGFWCPFQKPPAADGMFGVQVSPFKC